MLLKGVNVLDLSNLLPGPMCSLFLADLGAEVIKVESLSGDAMRYFEAKQKNTSPYFKALNRNKKSVALNLKAEEGKEIFMRLAKNADVVIEGFRPGKVEALGISYKSLRKINPKIVYCSITGYGQKGAYRNKAGHDLNYAALSGLLDAISAKPFVVGVQIADVSGALVAVSAIVSSLLYREKHGKGSYIDIAVLDATLSVIGIHIAYRYVSGNTDTILSGSKPCYNVYKTKDGRFVSLGAIEKKFWLNFCNAIKRKDLVNKQFDGSRDAMNDMQAIFKSKTMNQWAELSNKHDFCCEPVKKISEIVKDKHFKSRRMLIELEGAKQVAMPVAFSSRKKMTYSRCPNLGEHTKGILKKMGYNEKHVKELQAKGVIR